MGYEDLGPKSPDIVFESLETMTDQWLDGNEPERDLQGQLVFYTGLYEWADGTIRDRPQGDK